MKMKSIKIASIFAIAALITACLSGCDHVQQDPQNNPVNVAQSPPEQKPNVVRGFNWINVSDSKGVVLDPNLLRRNIYLILDSSGSMKERPRSGESESKIVYAKQAISRFVGAVPAEDGLGLLVFSSGGIKELVPLGVNNRKEFVSAVNLAEPDGGTPLSDAMSIAFEKLQAQGKKQLGYGEYHMVVVTDGEANPGYDPTRVVNGILSCSPIAIHTIGFGITGGHSLNQPGRIDYKEAVGSRDLEAGLKSVLAESENFDQTSFDKK